MLDNALISLFATQLDAAMASGGWSYPVIQKQQPTQEGLPTGAAGFFEKLFDIPYGWPEVTADQYSADTNTFVQTEKQWTETTFQVSALVPQDPTNLSLPTASDVVNYMKLYVNSRAAIKAFKAQGVSVLRITNVRNPYFRDERHLFEAAPNFDVVLQHQRILTSTVGATNIVLPGTHEGFAGSGTFPV